MNIKRKIFFTGKNLNDVFKLPCVKLVMKTDKAEPVLILYPQKVNRSQKLIAFKGDTIIQYEDGSWEVQ